MAEPKSLEEAMAAYEANQFSRKSLFRFVVDRIHSQETALTLLRDQLALIMGMLVSDRQNVAAEPPQAKQSQSERMKAIWAAKKAAQGEALTNG